MPILKLLKGIKHFKDNAFKENEDLYTALTKGQAPDTLIITCSDSRIIPTQMTHTKIGDLFTVRNAGNIIAPYNASEPSAEAASIEFGLKYLNAKEIIVCGHSDCGAMKGLQNESLAKTLPATARWLGYSRPILNNFHVKHPELLEHPSLELACLAQDNILLQIEHLKTHPSVQEKLKKGELIIQGWYYDFGRGEIYIYNDRQGKFISFEQTVEEFTQEKIRLIVEDVIANYLTSYYSITTAGLYQQKINEIKLNDGNFLWSTIKNSVAQKLWSVVGELYEMHDGCVDPKFNALIEHNLEELKPNNLVRLQKAIQSSSGHYLFCAQNKSSLFSGHLKGEPTHAFEESLKARL